MSSFSAAASARSAAYGSAPAAAAYPVSALHAPSPGPHAYASQTAYTATADISYAQVERMVKKTAMSKPSGH